MIHLAIASYSDNLTTLTLLKESNSKRIADSTKRYGEFPDDSTPNRQPTLSIDISRKDNSNLRYTEGKFGEVKTTIFAPSYGCNANELIDGDKNIWKSLNGENSKRIVFVRTYTEGDVTLIQIVKVRNDGRFRMQYYEKNGDSCWCIRRNK
ncbi:hypothetical protein BEWA_036940 [Theileria equi strain WA]|uniref:Signal peptide containing protein n=1 Tax=Theileria equi strain WA TaxID=1537102 RepID=L1LEQ1_THEEQ|nr:hypothetical protein BEWA_036940 [Theileria equi strain WA]EKX73658.1 hypothetical protein BEWA_036940 [Theileria equi strain WA]|eukprot:XP_004833110.1 hypothetical protein BEWA_036940 [Theileria equi strain WA]